ncbi:hypothetical protein [Verrucomicrobium sp. BvORR106]|uniref:hypothetical protein n=1 Tax=Verrucomicrobium sp. BvORR106 TaxID=1403819 RepID=UPI00056EA95E|nr:hypothetical protein [Verrucomicrobium sp. BvORR106]
MSEHDSDAKSNSRSDAGGSGWLLIVIALPILYILSPGPLVAVYGRSMPPSWALVYVAPLEWGCSHFKPLEKFYDKYLDLWRPR